MHAQRWQQHRGSKLAVAVAVVVAAAAAAVAAVAAAAAAVAAAAAAAVAAAACIHSVGSGTGYGGQGHGGGTLTRPSPGRRSAISCVAKTVQPPAAITGTVHQNSQRSTSGQRLSAYPIRPLLDGGAEVDAWGFRAALLQNT